MENLILANLNNPQLLERLYREDKPAFRRAFQAAYPAQPDNVLLAYWHARLTYTAPAVAGGGTHLGFVVVASLLAGLIAKLPAIFHLREEFFYLRNIGFVVFPLLSAYFAWRNKLAVGPAAFLVGASLLAVLFINWLPNVPTSDTLLLSCVHLLLFLWSLLGFAYVGGAANNPDKRLGFLKYNGDLVVITTLILIAGAIMTGITIGLFSLIGLQIEEFYVQYVVVFGLAAAPIVGTYLTQTNPQLVGRVSPVIARIFSPLVLVMLVVYLGAMLYSGKDPYNDREFLLIFNALLIGVLAIIFFSVSEGAHATKTRPEIWVLALLSAVTVLVNGVALSAILFRISTWGITPNRAAVLGGNVLILVHLLLVTAQLFGAASRKSSLGGVGRAIAVYLPIYFIWTVIVTFIFPFLFSFK
ncbi:hypothetical protein D3Y59_07395 [Hymenobacter oligotrophus]|uniref:DUF4153 domain-containing protein n=1 Tax=Hymenobacter oligotrophus TaxID=2319843 RepID=A0A3B7RBP1_9BACT|nr:hypothetical protein [Hymenobacter oligotrophus]AYA36896.1 hypothetical protein D3Y59_07395 [Hymenobacter oligotrophus]